MMGPARGAFAAAEERASGIDWHAIDSREATELGLALGMLRDSATDYDMRRVAWGTAAGGLIGATIMALLALVTCRSPAFALALVVGTQLARATHLWWKARSTRSVVRHMEADAAAVIDRLLQKHPTR